MQYCILLYTYSTTESTLGHNEVERVYSQAVLFTVLHEIDPCSVHTGMAEYIGQPHNIFLCPVEYPCEQCPQIVGKYF